MFDPEKISHLPLFPNFAISPQSSKLLLCIIDATLDCSDMLIAVLFPQNKVYNGALATVHFLQRSVR